MYNLIIVDDEEIIRKGLSSIVDWNALSFNIVGVFSDGTAAREYIRNNRVDAVLADILMPGLTGLELASSLRASNPGIRVIILSGYDSSTYARQAIDCNVFGYLLKPSREAGIIDVMTRLKAELDRDRQRDCMLDEHRHEAVARCLQGLCLDSGYECDYTLLPAGLKEKWTSLCLVEPCCTKGGAESGDAKKSVLAGFATAVKSLACEDSFVFPVSGNRLGVLVCANDADGCAAHAAEIVRAIEKDLPEAAGCGFSGAAGSVFRGLQGLSEALKEAESLLGHRLYLGTGIMIGAGLVSGGSGNARKGIEKETASLLGAAIARGDTAGSARIVDDFFSELIRVRFSEFGKLAELLHGLWFHLGENLSSFGFDPETLTGPANPGSLADSSATLSGMGTMFGEIAGAAASRAASRGTEQPRKLMMQACSVIERRFQGDLGLEDVAAELGISPAYLSRLFKKEIGRNFKEYLTDVRFEKAERLLAELDLKVYEIAEMSGFRDQHYFSELFKKRTGCTPLGYRERLGS